MSYDRAIPGQYSYADLTFGATTVTHNIQGPPGCVGFVRDISVDVATALVGTTSVPEIDVGNAANDFTYGRFRLGSAAGTGLGVGNARASQTPGLTGNPPRQLNDFPGHVVLDGGPLDANNRVPTGRIPANANVVITCKAGTGGTPAGGGTVRVEIDWIGQPIS